LLVKSGAGAPHSISIVLVDSIVIVVADWKKMREFRNGKDGGVPPCFFKECASGVESTRCKYSNFGSVEGVCFVRDGGRVSEGILAVCSNSWGDMEEYTMW
jgi:hypothetical protein